MTAPRFAVLLDLAAIGVVGAVLLWPAAYNGYPLIYPDSALYIALSFAPQEYVPRGLSYPLLIHGLHLGYSLWLVILTQALVAAWVLHETVAVFAQRWRPLWLLALGAALAILTGLPWTVDQVMPDFFAGLLALAIILPVLFPERLSAPRRFLLLALVVIAVAVHTSHAPLAIGTLLVAAAVLYWLGLPQRRLLAPLAATIGGIALVVAINLIVAGQAYYGRGGEQFAFGRLIDDGIVADYLNEVCPSADLSLCDMKDRLPQTHNDYLWFEREAFLALGGWDAKPELRRIVWDSIRRMPLRHLTAAANDTARQLVGFRLGDSLFRQSAPAALIIETAFPNEAVAFHDSLQQQNALAPTFELLDRFEWPVQLVALAALPLLAGWLMGRSDKRLAGFCLLVLAALLVNASICGVFSGASHRYQNRIAWIALVAVAAVALDNRHNRPSNQPLPAS